MVGEMIKRKEHERGSISSIIHAEVNDTDRVP